MAKLRLIHWNAAEAKPRIASLKKLGRTVLHEAESIAGSFTRWKAEQPDAVVIDLSRLPSHGREVAVGFRGAKATRHIPLIFVEGALEKVEAIRELLPDATYTTWAKLEAQLLRTLKPTAKSAAPPVVPTQMMDRYAGRTLAQKLGIREGASICLFDAPRGATSFLDPLPNGAHVEESSLHEKEEKKPELRDIMLFFFRDAAEFHAGLKPLLRLANLAMRVPKDKPKLWISWPKRTSSLFKDLSENDIRDTILAVGLVDYKVCAISPHWSGLAVAVKK